MARKIRTLGTCVAILVILAACIGAAFGQEPPANAPETRGMALWDAIFRPLFKVVVFGIVGFFFLLLSYKVIEIVTPFSINKEIAEDNNTAAGVLAGSIMIAIAIILHAAITAA